MMFFFLFDMFPSEGLFALEGYWIDRRSPTLGGSLSRKSLVTLSAEN